MTDTAVSSIFTRYGRIVDHYESMWPLLVPGYATILQTMGDIVRVREHRPSRILDLGCGTGSATRAVMPGCTTDARVTLVDGSPEMVSAAQTALTPRVSQTVVGDFADPARIDEIFLPQAFDLCLCSFAMHHLPDASKRLVVERSADALAPGGLLLLADEIFADQPAGWDLVATVRGRLIQDYLQSGRISHAFWQIETSLPQEAQPPFLPCRSEDYISAIARAGLAVSCPTHILGTALFVGLKLPS